MFTLPKYSESLKKKYQKYKIPYSKNMYDQNLKIYCIIQFLKVFNTTNLENQFSIFVIIFSLIDHLRKYAVDIQFLRQIRVSSNC